MLAYVESAREEGSAWRQISRDVGLSATALRRWREGDCDGGEVTLLPIEVVAEKDASGASVQGAGGVTLVSPGGYRVEGLEIEQLIAVLARIGQ